MAPTPEFPITRLRQLHGGHSACGKPSLKFIPTDKKWMITGNLLGVFAGVDGELLPVRREEKKSFARQVIQKGGE